MPLHDIQGHRRIIDLLSRSIQRGTLPPSLIFAGSSASGARPTAIAVAQAFNCLEPRTRNSEPVLDACGVCPACVRIARGVHPDVPIVEPAETGLIRLDPVRDVIDRAQLASHLRAMGALLRDIEVVGTGADAALLSNPDLKPELTHLAGSYRGERASAAYAAVDRALAALDRNAGVKAVADWVVLQL